MTKGNFLCKVGLHKYKRVSTVAGFIGWGLSKFRCIRCGKVIEELE